MSAQVEQWRVSTVAGVFETDLETLRQWITEGSVAPTDKVSKGNLNWIDAGRAPMLKAAFHGDPVTTAAPPSVSTAPADQTWQEETQSHPGSSGHAGAAQPASDFEDPASLPTSCYNHPQVTPHYICPACATGLCEACGKFLDIHRIATCPLCGEFCKVYEEVKARADSLAFQRSGFGFDDFVRAVRYPLEHKVALLCGALIYGLLRLGGLRGSVIAFVIMFGCMSHVISQVAWGRLNRSFMPDFSEFSLWDDLAAPIFLGLGITIVTWGPVIVLMAALFFGVLHAGPNVLPLGAGQAESPQRSVTPADLAPLTDPNADAKALEQANEKLNQLRPGTQSAGAVINPMIGLDTIRRMGATYFKASGMVLLVQAVGLIVGVVISVITAPLAVPFFGNLPGTFIDATIAFYFNLVIACLLGLSLFKCGERLGINVD